MPPTWFPATSSFLPVRPASTLLRMIQHLYARFKSILASLVNLRLQGYICTPNSSFFKLLFALRNSARQLLHKSSGTKEGDDKGQDTEGQAEAINDNTDSSRVTRNSFTSSDVQDDSSNVSGPFERQEHAIDSESEDKSTRLLNTIADVEVRAILEEMPIVDEPELIRREEEEGLLREPDENNHTRQRRKRALLIGIRKLGVGTGEGAFLNGPHRDVEDMRSLLEDVYDYTPQDIVCLIDNDEPGDTQPTKDNILFQINKLVEDAQDEDQFFFLFAGHCTQEDTEDKWEEEDGKNELIATSDNKTIMDNELRERLVDPLPLKSSLTAVFDTCHSCSLLDLPHYRCNRIYVPWINKGNRRTDTLQAANQRKLELPGHSHSMAGLASPTLRQRALTERAMRQRNTVISSQFDQATAEGKYPSGSRPQLLHVNVGAQSEPELIPVSFLGERHYTEDVDSPVSIFCDGDCRKKPIYNQRRDSQPRPNVICLSSSKDSQVTWEDPHGNSMIRCLVDMLRENPERSLKEVLSHVSHSIYNRYVDLHDQARGYKKDVKRINLKRFNRGKDMLPAKTVEMHNFQDPQISSYHPLDMDRLFEP